MIIRRVPEDFRVEEVPQESFLAGLSGAPRPRTAFAVYSVTKTSLSTPEAISILAKALGVRAGMVAYAGLKDKHAVTEQLVTVKAESERSAAGLPATLEHRGLSVKRLGWSLRGLEAADIRVNRFTIVVRAGEPTAMEEMERRAALLATGPGTLRFVNYFGDQRFGSARHGEGMVARHLIKGEFEQALKLAIATPARKDSGARRAFTRDLANAWGQWAQVLPKLPRCPQRAAIEALVAGKDFRAAFAALPNFEQRMFIDAYQSHLWNGIARRLAAACASEAAPAIRVTEGFDEMLFPAACDVPEAMRGMNLPLLSPQTQLEEPWAKATEEALREEGITLHDLRIPGLRRPDFGEAPRAWVVKATEFALGSIEADELSTGGKRLKRTIRFALPRGAYATVLLRALGQDG